MQDIAAKVGEPSMRQRLIRWFRPAPDSLAAVAVRGGKSPWADAVHLLWSVWVFLTPLFAGHFSRSWVVLTALSYPLFLLLFAKSCVSSRRQARGYALGLVLLSLVLAPWYPSGLTYFVFGCIMLRSCSMESRRYVLYLVALNAMLLLEAWLLGYSWQAMISIPLTTLIVAVVVHVERRNEERELELQRSHEEVRRLAATAERERIGRDLHDLLGHTLSLITLKLELSRRLHERGEPSASRREADEAERVARHALAEVRAAVTGIRSTELAVEVASAKLLLESGGVSLSYQPPPWPLPAELESALALVLREAATNIARHAGASEARIEFSDDGEGMLMRIADNGCGGIARDGNGLRGMRERVAALGGSLAIQSTRGKGSQLHIRLARAHADAGLPRLLSGGLAA